MGVTVLLLLLFCVFRWRSVDGVTSQRAKCAVECYAKCMSSGTPNSASCNCPAHNGYSCTSVNESIIKAETVNDVPVVTSEYLDAHRISLSMESNPQAFVYIFEYATVSTAPDDWMFAGTSTTPSITFAIADSCRDYQFRVIIVIRSNDPRHQIVVHRPRAIRVDLPEFAVPTDQIRAESATYNSADRTVVIYIRWKIPRGFADGDVYGYEGPAIYPIQCYTPEDELPVPSVEIVEGGGQMKVVLPAEMLESKCRLWVEVRMLPRCVRLEPFSIQQSLELDCDRLPSLGICRKGVAAQCTDIIDVWGAQGNATIMWVRPEQFGEPLYYHIRYGPSQMQGVPPFVSWTLVSRREVMLPGNSTSMNLQLNNDIDYGVQVCAVYTEERRNPKFELARVTPFTCTSCKNKPVEPSGGRCGECAKIEGPMLFERRCHPKGGVGCTNAFNTTSFVDSLPSTLVNGDLGEKAQSSSRSILSLSSSRIAVDHSASLDTLPTTLTTTTSNTRQPSAVQVSPASEPTDITKVFSQSPFVTDTAASINVLSSTNIGTNRYNHSSSVPVRLSESTTGPSPSLSTTVSTASVLSTEESLPFSTDEFAKLMAESASAIALFPSSTRRPLNDSSPVKASAATSFTPFTSTSFSPSFKYVSTSSYGTSASTTPTTTTTTSSAQTSRTLTTQLFIRVTPSTSTEVASDRHSGSPAGATDGGRRASDTDGSSDSDDGNQKARNTVAVADTELSPQGTASTALSSSSTDLPSPANARALQKSRASAPCTLFNGVLCEFGCVSDRRCECSTESHLSLPNGACVKRSVKGAAPSMCVAKRDVNATWDPIVHALFIFSKEVFDEVKESDSADRIYIEFGKVRSAKVAIGAQKVHLNGYVFDAKNAERSKMLVRAEKVIRHELFYTSPFIFYVNQTVDPQQHTYGLRICFFNSSKVLSPFSKNWDDDGNSQTTIDSNSTIVQVLQLSPVHFEARRGQSTETVESGSTSRLFFLVIPLTVIFLFVALLMLVLYLNRSRVKRFYDHRRTRYFRPTLSNVGTSTVGPYMTRGTDTSNSSYIITKPRF